MKLYTSPGACSMADHIALEWMGRPYTAVIVSREQRSTPDFKLLNPAGAVPVLEEGDWTLTQNAAILNYIADSYPEAKLGGDGSRDRAEVNRWLGFLNSDMHPAFKPMFGATDYLEDKATIEKTHDNARKQLRKLFERVDAQLGEHDWIAGDHKSIADPYLFVMLRWAKGSKVDLSGLDNLKKFEQRMRGDAAVQRVLKAEGVDQPA